MKRFLCVLCAFAFVGGSFAACSKKDNTNMPTNSPGNALHPKDYTFSADWPKNDFTMQLPEPKFQTSPGEPNSADYSIVCEAKVAQLKEYVAELKKAGFTIGANTADENAFSVAAYSYTASNQEGYTVEVNYSNMLGDQSTITIKKPAITAP